MQVTVTMYHLVRVVLTKKQLLLGVVRYGSPPVLKC